MNGEEVKDVVPRATSKFRFANGFVSTHRLRKQPTKTDITLEYGLTSN